MTINQTALEGVLEIIPSVFRDDRGYFMESFKLDIMQKELNIVKPFVLEFESRSVKNTIRGLHYQTEAHAQSKLVSVSYGKVLDIIVDIRKSSKTFMQYICIELSDENNKQVYIPKGYAHGFLALSDTAVMHYKLDDYYNAESYTGINIFDKELNIELPIERDKLIISQKDMELPALKDAVLFT